MWEWIEANWLTVLALLLALSCPLLHRWGGHGGSHKQGPPDRRREGGR